jgi:hypothetical protein
MISIPLFIKILIIASSQQFAISLNNGLDNFEESKVLPLSIRQEFAIELNELEKNAFNQGFCLFAASFLIK